MDGPTDRLTSGQGRLLWTPPGKLGVQNISKFFYGKQQLIEQITFIPKRILINLKCASNSTGPVLNFFIQLKHSLYFPIISLSLSGTILFNLVSSVLSITRLLFTFDLGITNPEIFPPKIRSPVYIMTEAEHIPSKALPIQSVSPTFRRCSEELV